MVTTLPENVVEWLASVVMAAPADIRLIYVEWNDGRCDGEKVHCFNAFGLASTDFDPEDPDSLDQLAEPAWEYPHTCAIPWSESRDRLLPFQFKRLLKQAQNGIATFLARGGKIAYGQHESSVDLYPPASRDSQGFYYELDAVYRNNYCVSKNDGLDDMGLRNRVYGGQKIDFPFPQQATFHLETRGKPKDLLNHSDWFVCSDRFRELIMSNTTNCQVFPVRVFKSREIRPERLVPGYFAIQLYELVECLHPQDVIPATSPDELPTFNAGKGYRIVKSVVKERQIFRIAYEYRRLVVSQEFRDKCEQIGITGIQWLRRRAV